jgi:hypothetical protein
MLIGALVLLAGAGLGGAEAPGERLLLDNFDGELSPLGTVWEGFTDRVMGGMSNIDVRLEPSESGRLLHLAGNVSLENNGGFIQVRMFLRPDRKPFDAGEYRGLELRVRGRGDGYYVHLRTTRTVFPWSYYAQQFPVREDWSVVRLPFDAFVGENMLSSSPNMSRLLSVAIVAAKKEFTADLYVDSVALYR